MADETKQVEVPVFTTSVSPDIARYIAKDLKGPLDDFFAMLQSHPNSITMVRMMLFALNRCVFAAGCIVDAKAEAGEIIGRLKAVHDTLQAAAPEIEKVVKAAGGSVNSTKHPN